VESDSPLAEEQVDALAKQGDLSLLKALEFDGVDDYMEVNHAFPFTAQVTVEMWMKGGPTQPKKEILFHLKSDDDRRILCAYAPWENGRLYFDGGQKFTTESWDPTSFDRISYDMSLSEVKGTWNHWAFVRDSGSTRMEPSGMNRPLD